MVVGQKVRLPVRAWRACAPAVVLAVTAVACEPAAPPPPAPEPAVEASLRGDATNNAVLPAGRVLPPLATAWQRQLDGAATNVVSAEGRVFVTVEGTEWSSAHVVALDEATGRTLWGPVDVGGASNDAEYPYPHLTYGSGRVFVLGQGVLTALDARTGSTVWSTRDRGWLAAQFPMAQGDAVLVHTMRNGGVASTLRALRQSDGHELWTAPAEPYLAADSTGVYVGNVCAGGRRLDRRTGAPVWRREAPDTCRPTLHTNPPVLAGGRVYLSRAPQLDVLDAATGALIRSIPAASPPVVTAGLVVVRTGSSLAAFDERSGVRRWAFSGEQPLVASVRAVGSVVYTVSNAGVLYGVDVRTGARVARHQLPAAPGPRRTQQTMAASTKVLVVPGGSFLTAFRNEAVALGPGLAAPAAPRYVPPTATSPSTRDSTGFQLNAGHTGGLLGSGLRTPLARRWTAQLPGMAGYPVMSRDAVFVASGRDGTYRIHAFERTTGGERWPAYVVPGPSGWVNLGLSDGRVVALTEAGDLFALDAATGRLLWSTSIADATSSIWVFDAPPTVYGGVVYVTGHGWGGAITAVGAAQGEVRWVRYTPVWAPVAVGNSGIWANAACLTQKLDRSTGQATWGSSTGCTGGGGLTPVAHDGRLYVRNDSGGRGSESLALDRGTRLRPFSSQHAPAFSGTRGFFATGSLLRAQDVDSGAVAWTFRAPGPIGLAPVVLDDTVYVGTTDGTLFGLDRVTGAVSWTAHAGAPLLGGEHSAWWPEAFAAAHGTLVVPASDTVVAYTSA